jgi:uncharacterized membrane protein
MTNNPTVPITRFVGLLFAGLFAGFLLGVLVLELSLRNFNASVYTQVRHVELDRLDDLASVTLIPALIATALLAFAAARRRERSFWLTLTALVLLVTTFAISLSVNLPINTDQAAWDVLAPPADWASVRDRWQIAHVVRTGATLLAFGCLSAAAMARTPSTRATPRDALTNYGTSPRREPTLDIGIANRTTPRGK